MQPSEGGGSLCGAVYVAVCDGRLLDINGDREDVRRRDAELHVPMPAKQCKPMANPYNI